MNKKLPAYLTSITAVSSLLISTQAYAVLSVTNFTAVSASTATGVWRNNDTSMDLSVPVTLSQTGGTILLDTDPSNPSVIDNSIPWLDLAGPNWFEPNFTGDSINVEVANNATSVITLNFNTAIIDPTINFSDIEAWTTLDFGANSFSVTGQTANLVHTGNKVNAIGSDPFFGDEAAGSVKFTGSFTSMQFSIINDGSGGQEDRTAFVVSTEATVVPEPSSSVMLIAGLGALMLRRSR